MTKDLKAHLSRRNKEHFLDSLVDNLKTLAALLILPAGISIGILISY